MSLSNPYDWTIEESETGIIYLRYRGEKVGELHMNILNAEEIQGTLNSTRTELTTIGNQY